MATEVEKGGSPFKGRGLAGYGEEEGGNRVPGRVRDFPQLHFVLAIGRKSEIRRFRSFANLLLNLSHISEGLKGGFKIPRSPFRYSLPRFDSLRFGRFSVPANLGESSPKPQEPVLEVDRMGRPVPVTGDRLIAPWHG